MHHIGRTPLIPLILAVTGPPPAAPCGRRPVTGSGAGRNAHNDGRAVFAETVKQGLRPADTVWTGNTLNAVRVTQWRDARRTGQRKTATRPGLGKHQVETPHRPRPHMASRRKALEAVSNRAMRRATC